MFEATSIRDGGTLFSTQLRSAMNNSSRPVESCGSGTLAGSVGAAVAESSDPQIARSVSEHNQEIYARIRELVELAQQEGFIDATIDPDVATWGYFSMLLAMQYSLMLNLKDRLNDKILLEMGKLWLRALRSSHK